MKYSFILNNELNYPVEKMCLTMKVSKNAYYKWFKNKELIKTKSSLLVLMERIQYHFDKSKITAIRLLKIN
jgi:hypothetical protein